MFLFKKFFSTYRIKTERKYRRYKQCSSLSIKIKDNFYFLPFFKKKIYLIYFWLHRDLVAARRIFRCGLRALLLRCVGFSLVVVCGFFFSLAVACRLQGAWALQLWHVSSRACGLCSLRPVGSS